MSLFLKSEKSSFPVSVALIVTILSPLFGISEAKYFFIFADSFYFPISVSLFFLVYFYANRLKLILPEVTIIDAFVFLFFLYNAINLWVLNNSGFNSSISTVLSPLFLYLVIKHYFSLEKENPSSAQNHFIISMLTIGLIPSVIGMLEYGGVIPIAVNFKITGGFLNPGVLANFIASIFPFLFAIITLKGNTSKSVKLAAAFVLLVAIVILVVSNARSAWVGSCVSAVFVLSRNKRFAEGAKTLFNNNIKTMLIISAVTISIVIASFMLYNLKKDSTHGRLFIWKLCGDLIKEKPIFGIGNGYNSFPKAFNEQQRSYFEQNPHDTDNGLLAGDAKYAFNDYLQLMIETGIVGVALFFCIIFFALIKKKAALKKKNPEGNYILLASKSSIIATLVCALFSYPLKNISNYALFFVFIAYLSSHYPPLKHRIPLTSKCLPVVSAMLALLASSILYYQICFLRNCYKWKEAYAYSQAGNMQNALENYKKIHPFFNSYFLFMFNYGSLLYVDGKFDEAIKIFESSKQLNATYDTFLNLGGCYEMISRFDKAEECYIRASNSIPHKLSPKYKLFKLYIKINQYAKAHKVASVIKDTNIKIHTPVADQMKSEILEYLKKNSSPPLSGPPLLGK